MTWEEDVFTRHKGKRVLLDSNLLLLLLIGSYERERIALFKRTSMFEAADYDLLVDLLRFFALQLTTPHILTEVGNLANSLPEHIRLPFNAYFAQKIADLTETLEESRAIVEQDTFVAFGLTDAAIRRVANDTLILTDDRRLAGHLRAQRLPVLNLFDIKAVRRSLQYES